jgi:hypothetical protein
MITHTLKLDEIAGAVVAGVDVDYMLDRVVDIAPGWRVMTCFNAAPVRAGVGHSVYAL